MTSNKIAGQVHSSQQYIEFKQLSIINAYNTDTIVIQQLFVSMYIILGISKILS